MATVYKILSPCLQECYVGSTTQKVERRWNEHKSDSKYGCCSSSILFEKHGYDNCKFVVMEVCPLEERREKEQWWLDHSVGAVNNYSVIQTEEQLKEYHKEYHEANKEKRNEYSNQYYEANKERAKEYQKQYYEANKEKMKESMKRYYEAKKASK